MSEVERVAGPLPLRPPPSTFSLSHTGPLSFKRKRQGMFKNPLHLSFLIFLSSLTLLSNHPKCVILRRHCFIHAVFLSIEKFFPQ